MSEVAAKEDLSKAVLAVNICSSEGHDRHYMCCTLLTRWSASVLKLVCRTAGKTFERSLARSVAVLIGA